MTPDEFASSRGHRLGKPDTAGEGRFEVKTCRRCGDRLVVSKETGSWFGAATERDCARAEGPDAA